MKHRATPRFWSLYRRLPSEVQELADRAYAHMQVDSRHPSLHLKKAGDYWSVRVGLHYRALAVEHENDLLWVWIGTHAEYDEIVG